MNATSDMVKMPLRDSANAFPLTKGTLSKVRGAKLSSINNLLSNELQTFISREL